MGPPEQMDPLRGPKKTAPKKGEIKGLKRKKAPQLPRNTKNGGEEKMRPP